MNSIETVFEWLLTASLRASILAGAILGIQYGLRRWLPAFWRHALWLPMLAVLVLPVLPEAPFALFPQTTTQPAAVMPAIPVFIESAAPVMQTAAAAPAPAPTSNLSLEPTTTPPMAAANVNYLAIAWLAGACGMLTAGVIGYCRNLRRIRMTATVPDRSLQAGIAEAARKVGLARAPHTWITPSVSSPAVTGLLRPVLLLPAGFPVGFSPAEARLILLHEFTHLKRLDLPLNWLMCVLQAMHWFNPLLWFAFARMRADRELACDARVLSIDASDRRAEYGGALLKLQCASPTRAFSLGFVGIFERGSEIKSRIREISAHRRTRLAQQFAGGVIVTLLMIFGVTKAQPAAPAAGKTPPTKEVAPAKAANAPNDPKLLAMLDSLKKSDAKALSALLPDLPVKSATKMLKRISADWGDLSKLVITDVKLPVGVNENVKTLWFSGLAGYHTKTSLILRSDAAPDRYMRVFLYYAKDAQQPNQFEIVEWTEEAYQKEAAAKADIQNKLNTIVIPSLDFQDVSVEEAIDILRLRAAQFDAGEKNPIKKGITIWLSTAAAAVTPAPIIGELHLQNVSIGTALKEICEQANLRYTVGTDEIVISPKKDLGAKPAVPADAAKTAVIQNKLKSITIPRIELDEVSLEEAIDFLRFRAAELDVTEKDPAKKGIKFVIRNPAAVPAPMIRHLRFKNETLATILKNICDQTKFRYTVDDTGVILSPPEKAGAEAPKPTIEGNPPEKRAAPDTTALDAEHPSGAAEKSPATANGESQAVATIGGQVRRPAPVPFVKGLTIYQAIQAAGGPTEFGSMRRVKIIRMGETRVHDLTRLDERSVLLQKNDTIEVPQKTLFGD